MPWFAALLLGCFAAFSSGCATPAYARPSTRLTVDDFHAMTVAMADSLSRTFASRGPDSEPWTIAMQNVVNLSSDVIPERERWAVMAQIQGAQPIQALWDSKRVRFVLPAERVAAMRESQDLTELNEGFGADRRPTHVLTGTFRSVTRAQAKDRTDLYYMEFDLVDLRTGEPVWNDKFEFKRAAHGAIWD
jgi:hypothetical protein